jgi:hypothetical protein
LGVEFRWVDSLGDAVFSLTYGGEKTDASAMGFFPNNQKLNILSI